jgi:hypothetical protein
MTFNLTVIFVRVNLRYESSFVFHDQLNFVFFFRSTASKKTNNCKSALSKKFLQQQSEETSASCYPKVNKLVVYAMDVRLVLDPNLEVFLSMCVLLQRRPLQPPLPHILAGVPRKREQGPGRAERGPDQGVRADARRRRARPRGSHHRKRGLHAAVGKGSGTQAPRSIPRRTHRTVHQCQTVADDGTGRREAVGKDSTENGIHTHHGGKVSDS